MIDDVSLGIIDDVNHRVIISSEDEIKWILEQINTNNLDVGEEYKVYQVVGYGDPKKVSEFECAQYIQSELRRPPAQKTAIKHYFCEAILKAGYSKDPFSAFTSARAAWNSAIQLMNNPSHVVIVKVTVEKPKEDTSKENLEEAVNNLAKEAQNESITDSDNNPEVSSGSENI